MKKVSQIDAGKINQKEILCFVISNGKYCLYPFLFDIVQNFDSTYISLNIVGITTNNLPVQKKSVSIESPNSIIN